MNVVITGASSGLGKHLYDLFKSRGDNVVGSYGADTKDTIADPWMQFLQLSSNSRVEDYRTFRDAAIFKFGGESVSVLINNAGTNAICPFEELTPYFIEEIMHVNFIAPVMMVQAFLNDFEQEAVIINVISDAAWRPMRHSLAYNCSKAALDMATKQMARELTKPHNISIIGVRPGKMMNTGMSRYIEKRVEEVRGWTPDQARKYFEQNSVSGLELHPQSVATFILDLVLNGSVNALSGACIDLVG